MAFTGPAPQVGLAAAVLSAQVGLGRRLPSRSAERALRHSHMMEAISRLHTGAGAAWTALSALARAARCSSLTMHCSRATAPQPHPHQPRLLSEQPLPLPPLRSTSRQRATLVCATACAAWSGETAAFSA